MTSKPTVRTHHALRLPAAARQRASRVLQAAAGGLHRAAASGLLVNLLVLAVTVTVVPLALREITSQDAAPAQEERQAAMAPAGAAQPQRVTRTGSRPVPARAGPVVYLVDSDEQAATVAQAIAEAERLAQDLRYPVDRGYPDASVIRLSSAEGLDQVLNEVVTGNEQRTAKGLPLARVVDLRAGAGGGRTSYQPDGPRRCPESMTVEIEPCIER